MKRLIVEEKSVRRKAFWRRAALPLFIWISLVYWELLLILGNGTPFFSSTLLYIAVFSVAGAAVICLLSTIFANEKANLVILTVTLTVIAVFFGVEYFCKVFFSHYMPLKSVFGGAKGVGDGVLQRHRQAGVKWLLDGAAVAGAPGRAVSSAPF